MLLNLCQAAIKFQKQRGRHCFSLGAQKCDFHPVDHQQMFDALKDTPKWEVSEESTARLPCNFWAIRESHGIRIKTFTCTGKQDKGYK